MALMVSVSGIRGIYGQDLNPENITKYAAAFGTWCNNGTVILGRDSRTTGEVCEKIVCAALQSTGCDVILTGISTTPTIAMAVLKHKAAGAIILSASHNPAEWNALKMLNSSSEFLDSDEGAEVLAFAQNDTIAYKTHEFIGEVRSDDEALDYHIQKILELPYIDRDLIASKNFKVTVDAVNGAGSESIPKLMEVLGVKKITKLHCVPNGIFPHNPEPLPEHLGDIINEMKKGEHDLGVVLDPDADRLALVDSNGRFFGEEYTQAAAFDFYLSKNKGDITTNLSSSMICDYVAQKHGVKCHRSAVGEINVVKMMRKTGSVISGEGNGGVINPDLHSGRDGLVGIAMILQFMAETNRTSAEIRNNLPNFFIVKNKIVTEGIDKDKLLSKVASSFSDINPDLTDGVKLNFEDGWAHLRKSNTETIIRLYTEADSPQKAQEIAERVKTTI